MTLCWPALAVFAFLQTTLVTLLQLRGISEKSKLYEGEELTPPSILQSVKQLLDREESATPLPASIGEARARPRTVAKAQIKKRILKVLAG